MIYKILDPITLNLPSRELLSKVSEDVSAVERGGLIQKPDVMTPLMKS